MAKDPGNLAKQSEAISGGTDPYLGMAGMRQVLNPFLSDIDATLGLQVWERMHRDPACGGAMETMQDAVLDDDIRVQPAASIIGIRKPTPAQEAEAKRAQELADFAQAALDALSVEDLAQSGIDDVARELLDALWQGFRVAETVFEIRNGQLLPSRIKPKPNRNVRFVVDPFKNVLGVVGVEVDKASGTLLQIASQATGEDIEKHLLPKERTLVFTNRPRNGDPRGWSYYDRAYNAWHLKVNVLPEYFRYLKQFAQPSIVGTVAENAVDGTDPVTGENQSPTVKLFKQLEAYLNASVMALPHGTDVKLLYSTGNGEAFRLAEELLNREIALGIHGSSRLLLEAQHGSRADGGIAQDVVGLRVRRAKKALGRVLSSFVRTLVRLNFPADSLYLSPLVTLADVEQQDQAKMIQACSSAFASGYLHASQLPDLHRQQGLPEADYEAMEMEREEESVRRRLAAEELGKMRNPGDPTEDDPEDE